MHRRILQTLTLTLTFCLFLLPGPSHAQFHEQAVMGRSSVQAEATRLLHEGYALERKHQWADALVHYEEAIRKYPRDTQIKQRLHIVRIRFDLSRRYADGSFVDSVRQLGESDVMELFDEVLVKIQAHYVEAPNWRLLIQRGIQNMEVALRDTDFLRAHQVGSSAEQITEFVNQLFQKANAATLSDRRGTEALALHLARSARAKLGVPTSATVMEFVCGATSSLDDYSTFLTPEQLDDVYSQIEGNFVGLGIELKSTEGALLITNVIRNGPADKAGMKAGERIIEVDRQSMDDISTEKAADLLKGEQGSVVQVAVVDPQGVARRLNVRRDRVEVPSVEDAKMVDREAGIAYLKLTSFQKTTSRDVDTALWMLNRQGMKSLIIDVRGNPGGLLTQSVEVADKFVTAGTIVSTRGRSAREDYDYPAQQTGTWRNVSLVVLIDGDSASASEIFAGAIHDHHRGTIVGDRSYGKGSVQGIFPLRVARTGVRLTTAKFYSPSGQPISGRGVRPDVVVRNKIDNDAQQSDAILSAGIEVARQQVARRGP